MSHPDLALLLGGGGAEHLAGCAACRRLLTLARSSPAGGDDRYERLEPLWRGGMGRTIRAWDRVLDREVLLKELAAPAGLPVEELRERFEREARLTARLTHPSILSVYDLGEGDDGLPFYAMPLIAGATLTERIAATPAAQRVGLVRVVSAAADAIAYAHAEGVVHRDLKPDNVLVGEFGQVVVIDWGLAAAVGEAGAGPGVEAGEVAVGTLTSLGVGTPAYMPPEQAAGAPPHPSQDVYALGATLVHALTGATPWQEQGGATVRAAHRAGAPPPALASLPAHTPAALVSLIRRAMAPDPADRFQDAAPFAADLRRFLDGHALASHRYTALERLVRWGQAHRGVLLALGAALLGAVVVGAANVASLRRAQGEALVALERSRAAEAELLASRPHTTGEAVVAALDALAVAERAGRAPAPATVAALHTALRAGPAARALPGVAGWGPHAVGVGGLVLADPGRRVWRVGGGAVHAVDSGLGVPRSVALSRAGGRWALADVDGRVRVEGSEGEGFVGPGGALAWLGEQRLVFAEERALVVTELGGAVVERHAVEASVLALRGGAGAVWWGDEAGGLGRLEGGVVVRRVVGDHAVTAVAVLDGRAWAGTTRGEVHDGEGALLAVLPGPVEAMAAAGDCLSVTLHDGLVAVLPIGVDCAALRFPGARGGGLRPDGRAVLVVSPSGARAVDTRTGEELAALTTASGLGGGFVDQRTAYVIGGEGVLLWDAQPGLGAHGSEVVELVGAGEGVLSAGRDGGVRWAPLGAGEAVELVRLRGGVAAAAGAGGRLLVGSFLGELAVVSERGVQAAAQVDDAIGAVAAADGGWWVGAAGGAVVRYDEGLRSVGGWTVPGGVRGLVVLPDGVLSLGLDGAARAWSSAGEPGAVFGGPDDGVGLAAVAAEGSVWLRTRSGTVRWRADSGEVVQTLAGRLLGLVDGGPVTADADGNVRSHGPDGALVASWSERAPPRSVTSTGLVVGDAGTLRDREGRVRWTTTSPVTVLRSVGGWSVAGHLDGRVLAAPETVEQARRVGCEAVGAVGLGCGR